MLKDFTKYAQIWHFQGRQERKIAKIKDQKSVKALRFDPREHC